MKKILALIFIISIISSCSKSEIDPILSISNTITTSGFNFEPSILNCRVGDIIFFELGSSHNAIEVSEENYNSNSPTPLENGFQFGASSFLIADEAKTYYYVCLPHLPQIKGKIIAE